MLSLAVDSRKVKPITNRNMQSITTTSENPLIIKTISETEVKGSIHHATYSTSEHQETQTAFKTIPTEQTQGLNSIHIHAPAGKLNTGELIRAAEWSDQFSNSRVYFPFFQNITNAVFSAEDSSGLPEQTRRKLLPLNGNVANTVLSIRVSAEAGIDPHEPFDVTPYAAALHNSILNTHEEAETKRPIQLFFASSDQHSALTLNDDILFIPLAEINNGRIVRGFRVIVISEKNAGTFVKNTAFEFLPADEIIPFAEAVIRVVDRNEKQTGRNRIGLNEVVKQLGIEQFIHLTSEERKTLPQKVEINPKTEQAIIQDEGIYTTFRISNDKGYLDWKESGVLEQKQQGRFAIYVNISSGHLAAVKAIALAGIIERYGDGSDIRLTSTGELLIRNVSVKALPALYLELRGIGLADKSAKAIQYSSISPSTNQEQIILN
ncbi:MAG: hypothetical protein Fur0041_02820 [Bacteroidia bacterium]